MYNTAKKLRNIRLFAYIAIVSYQVQTFMFISTDIVTGQIDEVTLYRGLSLLWSVVAIIALRAMHEMWDALDDVTKDIRSLQNKGHMHGIPTPEDFMQGPVKTINLGPMGKEEAEQKMALLEKILSKKDKTEPIN